MSTRSSRSTLGGMAQPAPLWRETASGHSEVTAYGHGGSVPTRRPRRWIGGLDAQHSERFQVDFDLLRAEIARLQVSRAAGHHSPSEGFQ